MAKSIPDIKGRPITEGTVVILLTGEQDNVMYPVWGGGEGHVKGIVDEIHIGSNMVTVDWENGNHGIYDVKQNQFGLYDPGHAAQKAKADAIKNSKSPAQATAANIMDQMVRQIMMNGMKPMYTADTGGGGSPVVLNPKTMMTNGSWDTDDDVAAKKKVALDAKLAHFDESKLDPLVIAPDIKAEIVALLKQSKHAGLIFEEWGLGEKIEYGRGMGMLFWGGPGTGKTWAATCIARAVNRELLIINAANIQTSEPGGANRNIEQAFTTAREQHKVLFLDECDSLITTRGDVGMILSSEINTLLTQIEKFEGICILATNRIDTLDEALERRLALIIEFPDPDYTARKAIWGVLVPKKLPLGAGVSIDTLAEYKLTGGQIKNVLLQAARLAAASEAQKVEKEHIEAAVKRAQKAKNLMGKAMRTHQHGGKQDYKVQHG